MGDCPPKRSMQVSSRKYLGQGGVGLSCLRAGGVSVMVPWLPAFLGARAQGAVLGVGRAGRWVPH